MTLAEPFMQRWQSQDHFPPNPRATQEETQDGSETSRALTSRECQQ